MEVGKIDGAWESQKQGTIKRRERALWILEKLSEPSLFVKFRKTKFTLKWTENSPSQILHKITLRKKGKGEE